MNKSRVALFIFGIAVTFGIGILAAFQTLGTPNAKIGGIPATSLTPILGFKFATLTPVPVPTTISEGESGPTFSLKGLDGNEYRLEAYRGRPVILNFWASWCAPCRIEMPLLEQASADFARRNVTLLGINNSEDEPTVRQFVEKFQLTFPILLDQDAAVYKAYGVIGMPTTFFIDKKGVVRRRYVGPLTEETLTEYLDELVSFN